MRLPSLRSIELRNFSLYALKPTIKVTTPTGVFCLAGANGLGKSTFLTTLNYGFTGIVPNANRLFKSVDEYYQLNKDFANHYFAGRIEEDDRERAEICIEFELNSTQYRITRGLFGSSNIRELSILGPDIEELMGSTEEELTAHYEEQITKDTGLKTFSQFVFIQHQLLTFDESRKLLFWNPSVLEPLLYMAFGVDMGVAETAEDLKRKIERDDSRVRNSQWDATKTQKRIDEYVQARVSSQLAKDYQDVIEGLKELATRKEELTAELLSKALAIHDCELMRARLVSSEAELRSLYSQKFEEYLKGTGDLTQQPLIVQSIQHKQCFLCGTKDLLVATRINETLDNSDCPICRSPLNSTYENDFQFDELRELDARIANITFQAADSFTQLSRLRAEESRLDMELKVCINEIENITSEHGSILSLAVAASATVAEIDAAIDSLREQQQYHLSQKAIYAAALRQHKQALAALQRKIKLQYSEAEAIFVPFFTALAQEFLGLELSITLESRTGSPGLALIVEIDNTIRRDIYQLSESQRFFVDIALRMAMTRYMTTNNWPATLFIDTPEGSLDIAYESRAGSMFAQFVRGNNNIVMTANLNSSHMLLSLASICRHNLMKVEPMMDWRYPSEVQRDKANLFRTALERIESALISGIE